MSTAEDDSSSGLNGRLRPRKSINIQNSPSSLKTTQDKSKRTSTPSKASPSHPEDLTNKSDPSFLMCPYCDKKFATKQAVTKHTRRIHLPASKQDFIFSCLFCNHVETDRNKIIQHMVDSHPNQYFACLDCHSRFLSTTELAEHKLNGCEKLKPSYRTKLRQTVPKKATKALTKADFNSKEYHDGHGFNGIVISCELKPSQVLDEADIEDKITTNLILPPSKNLGNNAIVEKNAVIVLDDLQWNKRLPANFSFHSTDADQILSRLGVVHRSPRTGESTRRDWFKVIDESVQKFEKCFDTNFYSIVASNVHENLSKFLDGSFNFNPDADSTIKPRKAKNSVVINTAEGFPILLASDQFSRNIFDGYMPRAIAPKHKWKWENLESERAFFNPDDIKRDSHVNNCIITLVSSLDIWTQLRMRKKYDEKNGIAPIEKKVEKQNVIGKELKEILESRVLEIPSTSSSSAALKSNSLVPVGRRKSAELPGWLGLQTATPGCVPPPAVLSGEWTRPRCYVCCACGAQTRDCKALAAHMSARHPNATVQHYEIVGEALLNADILKHLYVPPGPAVNRTRPIRGLRDCTKCGKSISLEELHQHMLDCAGDTPAVRRKVRTRPFGVRRKRTRLSDNILRKNIHKGIHTRQTRKKNHMRPSTRIRSEVGDAETIRKMLADLPAKRHRVMTNPINSMLRPRRKLDRQRNKLVMKRRFSEDRKRILRSARHVENDLNSKTDISESVTNTDETNTIVATKGNDEDEDNRPLKPRAVVGRNLRLRESIKRKVILNRVRRTQRRLVKNNDTAPQVPVSEVSDTVDVHQLSTDNTRQHIDMNPSDYATREQAGRDYSGRGNAGREYAGQEYAGREYAGREYAGREYTGRSRGSREHADGEQASREQSGRESASGRPQSGRDPSGRERTVRSQSGRERPGRNAGRSQAGREYVGRHRAGRGQGQAHAGKDHAARDHAGRDHALMEHAGRDYTGRETVGREPPGLDYIGHDHGGRELRSHDHTAREFIREQAENEYVLRGHTGREFSALDYAAQEHTSRAHVAQYVGREYMGNENADYWLPPREPTGYWHGGLWYGGMDQIGLWHPAREEEHLQIAGRSESRPQRVSSAQRQESAEYAAAHSASYNLQPPPPPPPPPPLPPPPLPPQQVPLKHSIASLTANSETHDKSVQFHHSFLVQQECNNASQTNSTHQLGHFENEAIVTKIDTPPLHCSTGNATFDPYTLQRNAQVNKPNKSRKKLNDCIAMLKNKLVEPPPIDLPGQVSVQCGGDDPIDSPPPLPDYRLPSTDRTIPTIDRTVPSSDSTLPNAERALENTDRTLPSVNQSLPTANQLSRPSPDSTLTSPTLPTIDCTSLSPECSSSCTDRALASADLVLLHQDSQTIQSASTGTDNLCTSVPKSMASKSDSNQLKNICHDNIFLEPKDLPAQPEVRTRSKGRRASTRRNTSETVTPTSNIFSQLPSHIEFIPQTVSKPKSPTLIEVDKVKLVCRDNEPKQTYESHMRPVETPSQVNITQVNSADVQIKTDLPDNMQPPSESSSAKYNESHPPVNEEHIMTESDYNRMQMNSELMQSEENDNREIPVADFYAGCKFDRTLVNIPPAHASNNVESIIQRPLDLSGRSTCILEDLSKHRRNYSEYDTLDLSNKDTETSKSFEDDEGSNDEVVDLSIRLVSSPGLPETSTSTTNANATDLSLRRHEYDLIPTDLSLKPQVELIDLSGKAPEDTAASHSNLLQESNQRGLSRGNQDSQSYLYCENNVATATVSRAARNIQMEVTNTSGHLYKQTDTKSSYNETNLPCRPLRYTYGNSENNPVQTNTSENTLAASSTLKILQHKIKATPSNDKPDEPMQRAYANINITRQGLSTNIQPHEPTILELIPLPIIPVSTPVSIMTTNTSSLQNTPVTTIAGTVPHLATNPTDMQINHVAVSHSDSFVSSSAPIVTKEFDKLRSVPKTSKLPKPVRAKDENINKDNKVEYDAETAQKIAKLPKELLDILGTIPKERINHLLNILPQLVVPSNATTSNTSKEDPDTILSSKSNSTDKACLNISSTKTSMSSVKDLQKTESSLCSSNISQLLTPLNQTPNEIISEPFLSDVDTNTASSSETPPPLGNINQGLPIAKIKPQTNSDDVELISEFYRPPKDQGNQIETPTDNNVDPNKNIPPVNFSVTMSDTENNNNRREVTNVATDKIVNDLIENPSSKNNRSTSNEKTASLRAVRIKAPSERQKSILLDKQLATKQPTETQEKNIRPVDKVNEESAPYSNTVKTTPIQQPEVTSTQIAANTKINIEVPDKSSCLVEISEKSDEEHKSDLNCSLVVATDQEDVVLCDRDNIKELHQQSYDSNKTVIKVKVLNETTNNADIMECTPTSLITNSMQLTEKELAKNISSPTVPIDQEDSDDDDISLAVILQQKKNHNASSQKIAKDKSAPLNVYDKKADAGKIKSDNCVDHSNSGDIIETQGNKRESKDPKKLDVLPISKITSTIKKSDFNKNNNTVVLTNDDMTLKPAVNTSEKATLAVSNKEQNLHKNDEEDTCPPGSKVTFNVSEKTISKEKKRRSVKKQKVKENKKDKNLTQEISKNVDQVPEIKLNNAFDESKKPEVSCSAVELPFPISSSDVTKSTNLNKTLTIVSSTKNDDLNVQTAIDGNITKPLRRSRRGKSMFIESNVVNSTIDSDIPEPIIPEQKAPLTKKQLIFSKLLDEEQLNKFTPDDTVADSKNNVTDVTTLPMADRLKNDTFDVSNDNIILSRSVKRKNMPCAKDKRNADVAPPPLIVKLRNNHINDSSDGTIHSKNVETENIPSSEEKKTTDLSSPPSTVKLKNDKVNDEIDTISSKAGKRKITACIDDKKSKDVTSPPLSVKLKDDSFNNSIYTIPTKADKRKISSCIDDKKSSEVRSPPLTVKLKNDNLNDSIDTIPTKNAKRKNRKSINELKGPDIITPSTPTVPLRNDAVDDTIHSETVKGTNIPSVDEMKPVESPPSVKLKEDRFDESSDNIVPSKKVKIKNSHSSKRKHKKRKSTDDEEISLLKSKTDVLDVKSNSKTKVSSDKSGKEFSTELSGDGANSNECITNDNTVGKETTCDKLTGDIENSPAEKRKANSITIIDMSPNPKLKKLKICLKPELLLPDNNEADTKEMKNKSRTKSTCYSKPAARRTRSKSVVVKSSSADMYDPYNIDLDEMIDEPIPRGKISLDNVFNKNEKKKDCKIKSNKLNQKDKISIDEPSTSKATAEYFRQEVKYGDESDSGESTKSDVPLKKYVQDKEKKNVEGQEEFIIERHGKSRYKKSKLQSAPETESNATVQNETEKELRSEKFMESFGFFCERKPRKSNLLAAKKISETFHNVSESDEVYFGLNRNKKTEGETSNASTSKIKKLRKKKCDVPFTTSYCDICKKQFRRPDNYMRHQWTILHVSKLSEVELKFKTVPVPDEPNHLVAYRHQMEKLKILTDELAKTKKGSKAYAKIKIPSMQEILHNVHKAVREQQISRGLSRDEALFLDCCELLKESHKPEAIPVHSGTSNIATSSTVVSGMDILERAAMDTKNDEDVDSVTAINILESEEVKNLENDLISGLQEAANAQMAKKNIQYQTSIADVTVHDNKKINNDDHTKDDLELSVNSKVTIDNSQEINEFNLDTKRHVNQKGKFDSKANTSKGNVDPKLDNKLQVHCSKDMTDGKSETKVQAHHSKDKYQPKQSHSLKDKTTDVKSKSHHLYVDSNDEEHEMIYKEKMYPDILIEDIDMFEDKFDKIKRKCRSQAAAAKQILPVTETNVSVKVRKKSGKKKGKKNSQKNSQNMVMTKGALKGFEGIKVSIPTSEIDMSAVPAIEASKKKKKKRFGGKKKSDKRVSESGSKHDTAQNRKNDDPNQKKVDVYEFMDNEDTELFEFRPSTLMERFKSISNKELPSTSKISSSKEKSEESEESVSDGDDFVYMSDDYVCSEDETEASVISYEVGGNKANEGKKSTPIRRKDAIEKNAVMGKIFKHNAIRTDKKVAKEPEPANTKANMDQLFDSLLEDEPSSLRLSTSSTSPKNNSNTSAEASSQITHIEYEPQPSTSFAKDDLTLEKNSPSSSYTYDIPSTSFQLPLKRPHSRSPVDFDLLLPKRYNVQNYDTSANISNSQNKHKSSTKDKAAVLPKKYESTRTKNNNSKYQSNNSMSPIYDDASLSVDTEDSLLEHREYSKEKTPVDEMDKDFNKYNNSDVYEKPSSMDDSGVARQRARRKCTVGKQNVLAESWSSESEPDGGPRRPTSAESVMPGPSRRRKGKKREGGHGAARRALARHISVKKTEVESRVSSSSRMEPAGKVRRPVVAADLWAAESDEEPGLPQQHGWIVGDSHKKLVTLLAHAKGRKNSSNSDEGNFDD